MRAWLIDAYRRKSSIVLWLKVPDDIRTDDIRIEKEHKSVVYIEPEGERFLKRTKITYRRVTRKTYLKEDKEVLAVGVENERFEQFVTFFEKATKHRIAMYDADIMPEQMYLYKKNLSPMTFVNIEDDIITPAKEEAALHLKRMAINVIPSSDIRAGHESEVKQIIINSRAIEGTEEQILGEFAKAFRQEDPDIILMEYGFSRLPYLAARLEKRNIKVPFHRWDEEPIRYKGGRAYYTYGTVRYQDYAIKLHGRLLVDTSTMVGSECNIEAIIELCQLSGALFQTVAARSFGAVFQAMLVRELVRDGFLIPYKEKPVEEPLSMFELMKSDRYAHTFDPKIGFHKDVAEVDFCSMFPWLIYNRNISAETITWRCGYKEKVPGIPVSVSLEEKGLIPRAIKPLLDRRIHYKRNPSALNKEKAAGLKWVLVCSYGYLRFREFKLGLGRSHMAIGAYARETIIDSFHLAEEKGFDLIHGIVDALYIKKRTLRLASIQRVHSHNTSEAGRGTPHPGNPAKNEDTSEHEPDANLSKSAKFEQEVRDFCRELELMTGIPVSFEGIYKWIVFLPSINDSERPVPARYFGVLHNGDIKARGIEVRQRSVPEFVKQFQRKIIKMMAECSTKQEIIARVGMMAEVLRETAKCIPGLKAEVLKASIRISRLDYAKDIPQKRIIAQLKRKGIMPMPGQTVSFVFSRRGPVLPEDYKSNPDITHYRKLLGRALYVVLQPFGLKRSQIDELAEERQTRLHDFAIVRHVFIPQMRLPEERKGYSERIIKSRLEKQGWEVWRGGSIGIVRRDDIYPNVRRRYYRLCELLEKEHPGTLEHLQYLCSQAGMPDFICYRRKIWKFVEAKLGHEQLSPTQKRCIAKLQQLGFKVEVHKIAMPETKARVADVNLLMRTREVRERQGLIT